MELSQKVRRKTYQLQLRSIVTLFMVSDRDNISQYYL